jgi:uracil-DNA glycosylase family 4
MDETKQSSSEAAEPTEASDQADSIQAAEAAGVIEPEAPKARKKKQEKTQLYPADFDGENQPLQIWRNRRIGVKEVYDEFDRRDSGKERHKGHLHLAGVGSKPAEVMFISPSVFKEEMFSRYNNNPMMLNGAPGNLFRRITSYWGFKEHEWFYTAIVKYFAPNNLRPDAPRLRWSQAALEDEIRTIKPKIIVCLGKIVFDYLWSLSSGKARKFALKDVQGGFFPCEKFDCVLYPMDTIMTALMRPEYIDRFEVDIRNIRFALDDMQGAPTRVKVEQHYVVIDKVEQLANVMAMMKVKNVTRLAVDAEWHGQTWVGGQLRSFQWSWGSGYAAYLKLMDEKQKYCFDKPIEIVQNMLHLVFGDPKVKFIGHNASADMPWMKHWLKIDVYRRFVFDTMYAQHTANEYADLKLERLAVRYTDLGRYDIPLCLWKKDSKFNDENESGYGRVPDRIIIPYGLRDVDATMRSVPHLIRALERDGLIQYYNEFILPFVTDGFFEMMDAGLPINEEQLDDMRTVFTRNEHLLLEEFRKSLVKEADIKLRNLMIMRKGVAQGDNIFLDMLLTFRNAVIPETGAIDTTSPDVKQMVEDFKAHMGVEYTGMGLNFLFHRMEAAAFNINSTDQIKRWLFDVKGLKPLKSTKKDGVQLSWEKVLSYDAAKQLNYSPAADKQTIKVYADKFPIVSQLQELKSVGNIVKAFLKGPDEEGREQGIPKWMQSDGRIHANFALTETARPRAWKPNILNWPKAVTRPIEAAFERIQKAYPAHAEKPSCLRSVVEAPPGWCLIDMDLKTAEVVALAYQSGDENMIKVLTEPDLQFARIDRDNPKKVGRIAFTDSSCYSSEQKDNGLLLSPDDARILRREDGSIIYPKRDLHWEMAESVAGQPREKLDERLFRDGVGKVGNFSIPYGATATLLERLVEVNTGRKPDEGTGDKMIEAFKTRYPQADAFQQALEKTVEKPGYWRSLSGRMRHFKYSALDEIHDFSDYHRSGILSPLARQARNFPCQELVAATTGKALLMFIEERRQLGLKSRVGILLYDAIMAMAPLEEAKVTAALLKSCLTDRVPWTVKGRTFNFEVDVSYGFRWGMKPNADEKKLLAQYI